jgi:hypothetical protein
MNDVTSMLCYVHVMLRPYYITSMLYVSLVRQSETLLFYVVTSRIEALVVSRHMFLNVCVEKVYRLLLQPTAYCRSDLPIVTNLHITKCYIGRRTEFKF